MTKRSDRKYSTSKKGRWCKPLRTPESFWDKDSSRFNEWGDRKGVAQCMVLGCKCSGRDNWVIREEDRKDKEAKERKDGTQR